MNHREALLISDWSQESNIFEALVGDFDVYDIREPSNDPYPPESYVTYLQSSTVQNAIGAKQKYQECPEAPYDKFSTTGDVSDISRSRA